MRKILRFMSFCVLAAIVSVSFAACGGGDNPEPPVTPPAAETFTLTFSAENEAFGSVAGKNANGAAITSGTKFEKDTALTLTATANTGYTFDGWYKGTDKVGETAEYSFSMPANDLTLVAKFTVNNYAFAYSSENAEKGTVSCEIASGTSIDYNTSITLNATPKTGYTFDGWYDGSTQVSTDAEYTFNMPARALTLQARFNINSYTFTYSSENTDKGNVSGDIVSGTSIDYNTSITLTATANTGYTFDGWYDGSTQVSTEAAYTFNMPAKALTLQARFNAQKRTVNFYVDADVIDTKQVDYNTPAPTGEVVAEKAGGFEFNNWFTDSEFKNAYGGEPIKSNTDLYAKFTAIIISYRVRFFDYDGSKIGGDQMIEQGNEASVPADPQRVGFNFTGWTFNDAPLDDGFKVNSDMDIYATYTEKEYDVHFYLSTGVEMAGSPQIIKHGKTAVKPITPSKEDYVFVKWLLNNEYEFDFDTPITDELEIYAEWKAVEKTTYIVKFYDELGGNIIDTQTVEEGGDATAPQIPEKVGKKFKEWVGDFTNVTNNIDVYATYETATFEVTFVYYDETQNKDVERKVTVDYGTAATAPTATEIRKTGYTFSCWDKEFTSVTEDIKVTAVYTINTFTATFYLGSDKYGTPEKANYGANFKIPTTPDVAGYSFMGWFKDELCTIAFDFTAPVTENVDVYGKLEEIIIQTYTVRFLDFDNRVISEQTVVENEAATAPGNPSRTGYTFTGWLGEYAVVTENLTIRATYTPNKYNITYYQEDGVTPIGTEQTDYGSDASNLVEAPEVTGKEFLRWSKDLTFVTKDTEVYAIYANNIITVKFMDEDGTTLICTQSVEYGGHASIPNTPAKSSCIFKAWVVAQGSDEVFNFNTVITAETEIYAKWENISGIYSVYFKDYDGNAYDNVQRIRSGFTADEPSTPEPPSGKVFDGWYIYGTEDKFDFNTPITATITLIARAKVD